MIRPDERKIRRYQKEIRNFNATAYRKAFYRTGEALKKKGGDKR